MLHLIKTLCPVCLFFFYFGVRCKWHTRQTESENHLRLNAAYIYGSAWNNAFAVCAFIKLTALFSRSLLLSATVELTAYPWSKLFGLSIWPIVAVIKVNQPNAQSKHHVWSFILLRHATSQELIFYSGKIMHIHWHILPVVDHANGRASLKFSSINPLSWHLASN